MGDLINAGFEVFGFVAVSLSIVRLYKDKQVKGLSILTLVFFTSWGAWNLYYYPSLGQLCSTVGAACTFSANTIWVGMVLYYSKGENK